MLLEPFTLPFVQRGVAEVLLLAVASGLLGTWIVLRGLAFFAHAVGTATFPGLVLADGLAFSPALGAFGAALLVAALVAGLGRGRRAGRDSVIALVLAAALALGVVLASDVFGSQARVDRLLFGSLLLIDAADLRLAAAAALAVAAASALAGPRWLADGFAGADAGRRPSVAADALLVVLVALVAVAALAAVGALLATALLVVPAATTRLVVDRLRAWQAATVALAAAEGVAGLWLAYHLNAPPGAAIAVLGGAVFAAVVTGRALARRRARGRVAALAGALLAVLALGGCGAGPGGFEDDGRISVAATTPLTADLARAVGGEAVQVREILPANADPHEYEPRPKDVQAVADADIVVTSGLGLDAWARSLVDDAGGDARVVDLGAAVSRPLPGEEGEQADPHWWHDPANVVAAGAALERSLTAAAPARADEVRRAGAAFRERVRRLDRAIAACVRAVPVERRRIVTDHDAFGYLARRYGITIVGAVIPSQTTRAQASAGDLARLERTIRREGVSAVFPEAAVNAELARRLARDTGVSSDQVLYGDTLGKPGTRAGTYLGMTAANARALVAGMSDGRARCRLPA